MINRKLVIVMIAALTTLSGGTLRAAEVDHSAHAGHDKKTQQASHDGPYFGVSKSGSYDAKLQKLDKVPPSGRAREATSDDRYIMESTSALNDTATQCAHGSRGLVMVDNATWEKCGGKPQGAAKGAGYYPAMPPWNKEGTGEVHKMDHSKHNM
ncbi:hypothetical protein [Sulfuriflexus mobilis]|uniref:hypothetical protein n=1 Tax=Sulfuriflexus mobilis TaxID=1811807 RepID=UPI000F849D30|nr:hypothetical protein [Sulfuriflexus mobilis]